MLPSRELDTLIAEKVMMLDPELIEAWNDASKHPSWVISRFDQLPRYSSDIKAAWQVVEKIKNLNFIGPTPNGKWNVVIGCQNDGDYFGVIADTAPHAICLAALKTVGVNYDIP